MSACGDFWDSNILPIAPQGKIIAAMSASAREELRTRLRGHLRSNHPRAHSRMVNDFYLDPATSEADIHRIPSGKQNNARLSVKEIAAEVGLAPSSTHERIEASNPTVRAIWNLMTRSNFRAHSVVSYSLKRAVVFEDHAAASLFWVAFALDAAFRGPRYAAITRVGAKDQFSG